MIDRRKWRHQEAMLPTVPAAALLVIEGMEAHGANAILCAAKAWYHGLQLKSRQAGICCKELIKAVAALVAHGPVREKKKKKKQRPPARRSPHPEAHPCQGADRAHEGRGRFTEGCQYNYFRALEFVHKAVGRWPRVKIQIVLLAS